LHNLLENRLLPPMAVVAVFVALPWFFPSAYYYRIGALVFIFALAVAGLNLLMGFAGQVSLGHAGFLGIGAYSVAIGPAHGCACSPERCSQLRSHFVWVGQFFGSRDTISPSLRSVLDCLLQSC
jgi:ABC-type branched-subunit amino acid transport system permease subunit